MLQAQIARSVGVSESTVSRVLARAGLSRLGDLRPVEPGQRYEHEAPGSSCPAGIGAGLSDRVSPWIDALPCGQPRHFGGMLYGKSAAACSARCLLRHQLLPMLRVGFHLLGREPP
jgi:hypothetical protein